MHIKAHKSDLAAFRPIFAGAQTPGRFQNLTRTRSGDCAKEDSVLNIEITYYLCLLPAVCISADARAGWEVRERERAEEAQRRCRVHTHTRSNEVLAWNGLCRSFSSHSSHSYLIFLHVQEKTFFFYSFKKVVIRVPEMVTDAGKTLTNLSVWEESRSLSFSFLVFHHTDTQIRLPFTSRFIVS